MSDLRSSLLRPIAGILLLLLHEGASRRSSQLRTNEARSSRFVPSGLVCVYVCVRSTSRFRSYGYVPMGMLPLSLRLYRSAPYLRFNVTKLGQSDLAVLSIVSVSLLVRAVYLEPMVRLLGRVKYNILYTPIGYCKTFCLREVRTYVCLLSPSSFECSRCHRYYLLVILTSVFPNGR